MYVSLCVMYVGLCVYACEFVCVCMCVYISGLCHTRYIHTPYCI